MEIIVDIMREVMRTDRITREINIIEGSRQKVEGTSDSDEERAERSTIKIEN